MFMEKNLAVFLAWYFGRFEIVNTSVHFNDNPAIY